MRNLVKQDFKGVISIEEHGKWVFKQAYGEADLANQRLNRLETKFPMASGSKVFIAVAILQLIEGKFIFFDWIRKKNIPINITATGSALTFAIHASCFPFVLAL